MKLNYQVTRRNPDGSELNLKFSNNQQGNYNKKKYRLRIYLPACLRVRLTPWIHRKKKEAGPRCRRNLGDTSWCLGQLRYNILYFFPFSECWST